MSEAFNHVVDMSKFKGAKKRGSSTTPIPHVDAIPPEEQYRQSLRKIRNSGEEPEIIEELGDEPVFDETDDWSKESLFGDPNYDPSKFYTATKLNGGDSAQLQRGRIPMPVHETLRHVVESRRYPDLRTMNNCYAAAMYAFAMRLAEDADCTLSPDQIRDLRLIRTEDAMMKATARDEREQEIIRTLEEELPSVLERCRERKVSNPLRQRISNVDVNGVSELNRPVVEKILNEYTEKLEALEEWLKATITKD